MHLKRHSYPERGNFNTFILTGHEKSRIVMFLKTPYKPNPNPHLPAGYIVAEADKRENQGLNQDLQDKRIDRINQYPQD
jgi:hypothetical protein